MAEAECFNAKAKELMQRPPYEAEERMVYWVSERRLNL